MAKAFNKLTRPSMRRLVAGERLQEHGIVFERLPNGDGVFTVNIMVDGVRVHRTIGRESDGITRTQAEQFIASARSASIQDRLQLPKGRKIAMSFAETAQAYMTRLSESGGKDMKMKQQRLALHLVPFFGALPLSKITTFEIERYKQQRMAETPILRPRGKLVDQTKQRERMTKPATVNRELAVLSHLLNKALEWGWLDRHPARIPRLQESSGRITYLTAEQVARVVEAAKHDQNPQIYPFVVIALSTAMRRSEVLAIRKEHVDLARRVIHVPRAKAGPREQPITQELADFLSSYMAASQPGTPWLFPSPGARSGHAMDIRKPFRRAVAAAGLNADEVVRHTLRHTAITHLVQAGVDLPTVKRISGHKTLAMVERYAHQNGAHIQTAMDKLQDRLSLLG